MKVFPPLKNAKTNPISSAIAPVLRSFSGEELAKADKPKSSTMCSLFDIEIFVSRTKLKILILRDRLDILLANEALRLIRRAQVKYLF